MECSAEEVEFVSPHSSLESGIAVLHENAQTAGK